MNKIMRVNAGIHGQSHTEIQVDSEYIIQPLNPRKLKNRGRHCFVIDFVSASESHPNEIVAKVRFTDNNRIGKVQLSDLTPV